MFEALTLGVFEAGLSWSIVFGKRDAFRRAFHGFDIARVAAVTERDVDRLMQDPSIIRNRAKIRATVENAHAMSSASPSLPALARSYESTCKRAPRSIADLPTSTPQADAFAKELKSQGYRFVGPTSVYAFMQNVGVVNDHIYGCFCATDFIQPPSPARGRCGSGSSEAHVRLLAPNRGSTHDGWLAGALRRHEGPVGRVEVASGDRLVDPLAPAADINEAAVLEPREVDPRAVRGLVGELAVGEACGQPEDVVGRPRLPLVDGPQAERHGRAVEGEDWNVGGRSTAIVGDRLVAADPPDSDRVHRHRIGELGNLALSAAACSASRPLTWPAHFKKYRSGFDLPVAMSTSSITK